jgi:hypothetical protein
MHIQHVPLLQIERDLHDLPRGMERFQEYLRTMMNDAGDDIELVPMMAMNPMGREHVATRLDELLAFGADAVAAEAVSEGQERLFKVGTRALHSLQSHALSLLDDTIIKHGLVICDDVHGGWTNRYTTDASIRFSLSEDFKLKKLLKRPWLTTMFLVSESYTPERVRREVLVTIYRFVHLLEHGPAKTLRQIMTQEGRAAAFAGMLPRLDADDLAYSREILQPYLDSTSYPVIMAAMYGDNAARSLGYEPLGLSDYAGFAVGLMEAIENRG